ncbi:MAG: HAD family hydrolase [Anaerolineae bacterium]|nr:HAD family hydrolase [Anaerolineae bacterium]
MAETPIQTLIFFDIDATLLENHFSRRVIVDVLQDVADETGHSLDDLGLDLGKENYRRQYKDPDHPKTMDWQDIAEAVAKAHGGNLKKSLDELWVAYAQAEEIELLDDSPSVIKKLKAPHRKLVIATKGLTKYQVPILKAVGLYDLFDDILAPDITGLHKATPGFHDRYTKTLPDSLVIQVGDHFVDDVIAPVRNGFTSILRAPFAELVEYDAFERPTHLDKVLNFITTYPRDGSDVRPHAVVMSLQELPDLISRIEAEAHSAASKS